jgi:hypothetical protein
MMARTGDCDLVDAFATRSIDGIDAGHSPIAILVRNNCTVISNVFCTDKVIGIGFKMIGHI